MQSAETINSGTYKLQVAPIIILGKNGADGEFGVTARGGYGFTKHFDAEAKVGFFENGTFLGVDGEYWLYRGSEQNTTIDFSLTGGLHYIIGGDHRLDIMGFEITPQVSAHVSPSLEIGGALDVSFESVQDAPQHVDDSFTRIHLTPGIEYRVSDLVDLVAEFGIGLNDHSSNYLGGGIAFYRR